MGVQGVQGVRIECLFSLENDLSEQKKSVE